MTRSLPPPTMTGSGRQRDASASRRSDPHEVQGNSTLLTRGIDVEGDGTWHADAR